MPRYGNERVEKRKFEFIHQLVLFMRVRRSFTQIIRTQFTEYGE